MFMALLCIGIKVIECMFELSSMVWAIQDVGMVPINKTIFAKENYIGYLST